MPKLPLCVVGLDGVPHSLLLKLIEAGDMPVLAELAAVTPPARMSVTLPEISAVSWTSFMTGVGPGTHGIYGFVDLAPGSKKIRFPSFRDVEAPTLWDRLAKSGIRSMVLSQPATYPARPIMGCLVSGFVAIDLMKAVQPLNLYAPLSKGRYELDIDTIRARQDTDYLMEALDKGLDSRRLGLNLLWDREEWGFFQVVITGTDRLQHYLWSAIENQDHPRRRAVRDYYRKVDAFVGEVLDRFTRKIGSREEALRNFFVLSDHGFTGIEREFNLNAWLRREGYQEPAGPAPDLEKLGSGTKAFALDPGRIFIHRKGRFSGAPVEEKEVKPLAEEIREKLMKVEYKGRPVVEAVFHREEIYEGPRVEQAADLIARTHYGFDVKGTLLDKPVLSETDLEGMHTWDDAFFWSAEPVAPGWTITQPFDLFLRRLADG